MGLFRTQKGEEAHEGEMTEMEKFVEFWGGTGERKRKNAKHAMDGKDTETIK